jgi:transposase|uniref:IS66 family transposase n=1 Tax=uncultured Sphingomonas sp. TaxID=158754 RepID=UPI00258733E2|nr:IS66 family transposase [uncultured Sphingomonas sp.]
MENGGHAGVLSLEEALARLAHAEAEAARVKAINSDLEARNALLELQNAKMRHELFGQRSEHRGRLVDQLELGFEEAQISASEDEVVGDVAARKTSVRAFVRKRSAPRSFPDHLPRERVVIPAPTSCPCCGSDRLSKLGEDVTETLEVIPRQWKVIQTVREKVSCRACEKITQPPAPFHVTPRGMFGPSFLAMLLFEKFGQHQPLNRQRDRYAREGIDLSLSTLADQVGACVAALRPLTLLIEAHVKAAERLHIDDTTVPVLAKTKTITGRLWTYVRDDRPFGGPAPLAAFFRYSRDRSSGHPLAHLEGYSGTVQADAYSGYNAALRAAPDDAPLVRALCWAHGRRPFFKLVDISTLTRRAGNKEPIIISPLAREAVDRIDAIFAIERTIRGRPTDERHAIRQEQVRPLVEDLEAWMHATRAELSRHDPVAKAIAYMTSGWADFTRFLDDGRICMTNNAAERALRGIALGRKSWLFAGSDRGGERAADLYSLIVTAKLNDVDPQAWLADVLDSIAGIPQNRLHELLPWAWRTRQPALQAAA